ncbi:MAG: 5'-deoxynucleotidase [Lachnospiraceae bacterium]|nr:5'-deoxynucleotidase [Lachnospiraceae bacterium]
MNSHFFATVSRMKYIERWALMRNSRPENLSEHAAEVAMIAHALCTIGNVRYGRSLNAERAALVGLYHDASEIITGDMPTPVKYYNRSLKSAYKEVERIAEDRLVGQLPEDLQPAFSDIFGTSVAPGDAEDLDNELYMRRLVKAADKLSALIKCMEEESSGNQEFSRAGETTRRSVEEMAEEMPEVKDFLEEFLPSYGKTLDELLETDEC